MTCFSDVVKALDELNGDSEFARRIEISDRAAEALIEYLADRGIDQDDAGLLGLAYFVGRTHALQQSDALLKRIVAMAR